jgi:hypothetical protein
MLLIPTLWLCRHHLLPMTLAVVGLRLSLQKVEELVDPGIPTRQGKGEKGKRRLGCGCDQNFLLKETTISY